VVYAMNKIDTLREAQPDGNSHGLSSISFEVHGRVEGLFFEHRVGSFCKPVNERSYPHKIERKFCISGESSGKAGEAGSGKVFVCH